MEWKASSGCLGSPALRREKESSRRGRGRAFRECPLKCGRHPTVAGSSSRGPGGVPGTGEEQRGGGLGGARRPGRPLGPLLPASPTSAPLCLGPLTFPSLRPPSRPPCFSSVSEAGLCLSVFLLVSSERSLHLSAVSGSFCFCHQVSSRPLPHLSLLRGFSLILSPPPPAHFPFLERQLAPWGTAGSSPPGPSTALPPPAPGWSFLFGASVSPSGPYKVPSF